LLASIRKTCRTANRFSENGTTIYGKMQLAECNMKTLLVLSQHPDLANSIRECLSSEQYKVVHRLNIEDAEPLLIHGLINATIIDVDLTDVQGIWIIEKLRRNLPKCPILLVAGPNWEWEEEAYLHGVSHIFTKPVKPRLLNTLLERLWSATSLRVEIPPSTTSRAISRPVETVSAISTEGGQKAFQALEILRDFSAILTHSLCAEAMLKQFLLFLRELIGVNRATIFLRQSASTFGGKEALDDSRRMRSACAIGLSAGLLEHFQLSFDTGIGGHLFRHNKILRRGHPDAQSDLEIQKEFELLGSEVAIPILDRESLVGVATFDGRVTGESLSNGELELIFHLLEELALAVKNISLHDQLSANHEMMADILRQLSSACIVINRDLTILHVNKMARKYFASPGRRNADLEFSDLPQALGSKVYQVLKTGTAVSTFKYNPPENPETIYHVTIVPFQGEGAVLPNSALLMVDDHTQSQQLQHLEIEAANLRLVKMMADRLAHEIGNAMVPISTHQQLLSDKYKDSEFRASLDSALADGVKRVGRLLNQMRFLARDSVASQDAFPLAPLIEEAFQEAKKQHPVKSAQLKYDKGNPPIIVEGDHGAIKHALAEVMLNALQANASDAQVIVRTKMTSETNGSSSGKSAGDGRVYIEIQDNGAGFAPEAALKVPEPFFTTRNVGLGLGLTVSQKIIETHHGKLEIVHTGTGESGIVRVSLPVESTAAVKGTKSKSVAN
jgi:nitrogen-specific signal transduction histidine kinase/CheY-like chemotaxis protein